MTQDQGARAETISVRTSTELWADATSAPESPLIDIFYEGYDRSFVLPNEKEERAGFAECLALNRGAAGDGLAARFGEYREMVMVLRHGEAPVAGANFIAYPLQDRSRLALNLNYLYVMPSKRRSGYFAPAVRAAEQVARAAFGLEDNVETLTFIEQNDPLKMSAEAYDLDTQHTGLDQIARLSMWARLGARIVDFPYVQPPLSAEQEADDTLLYSVLGAREETLSACVLLAHLERFFCISVLKGGDLQESPAAAAQIRELKALCARQSSIRLLDPVPAIARLGEGRAENPAWTAKGMRELAHRLAP
jgi:hypothetical protein